MSFDSQLDHFCDAVSIIAVSVSLVFPFANGFYLARYRAEIIAHGERRLLSSIGELYKEYESQRWTAYMQQSLMAARRLAYVLGLVYLGNYPQAQLVLFQVINSLVSLIP